MSQYNKTVLTRAGLELAKRANAGQAKFGITRAVTSADDWSHKTVQDLEEVTTIPNIMQQGTIMDTDEVESSNSVIDVSLCFTNKNLSTGYQIRIIGLYVKEEGQENDFLYAVTTAITPEYMPSFADKVLYRFNTQMYLVIGNAQSVNVVINDGTAVTHGQLDKYKAEVAENLKKLESTHKEDMSHVAKSASINGGAEILPDSTGKLNLVVPDPDLSKYVSLEQLGELLKAKADKADTYTKSNIDDIHSKSYFRKQGIDQNGNAIEIRKNAIKLDNGGYAFDIWNEDWTASKLVGVLTQLPNKADTSTVNAQIADVKDTAKSNLDKAKSDLNDAINTKANSADVYTKTEVDSKTSGTIITDYDIASKTPTKVTDRYTNKWLVDQAVLFPFADQINQLKGRRAADTPDFNTLTDSGVYMIDNPSNGKNFPCASWGVLAVFNGNSQRIMQIFSADNGTEAYVRTYGWINDTNNWGNWNQIAWKSDISNLQNQIQQLKDNQFEVQTFTDATAAANWEAQKPGKRMAIVNS